MGNSSLRPSLGADAAVNFQADLPKFILQSKIGNGKLMKTYLMRCESNSVVVKVYMSYPDEELRIFAAELTRIWYTISPSKFPNLLPYQLWMKSTSRPPKSTVLPIYLIRQYLYCNLHDRISTRPFLNEMEKYWILYQMFKCLETCHDLQIMHGDIKPENILCTTSNWVVLTDFAAFKPVNVPDDNPSDFQYFFDSMSRPRCYIAPERFCNKSKLVKRRSHDKISIMSSPPSSQSSKRVVVASSTSLTSFERASDSALLSDSVFGDAASAIRSHGPDTEKQTGKRQTSTEDADNEKEVDDRDEYSSRKLYSALTVGMDVFSLGCTVAEVILDGEPFLDLPGMLRYANRNSNNTHSTPHSQSGEKKSGTAPDSSPGSGGMNHLDLPGSPARGALDRIGGAGGGEKGQLRRVIAHMTQRDPDKRLSVAEYRQQLESSRTGEVPFPPYFTSALYPLFLRLHWEGTGPDQRIAILCECYNALMESITGDRDETGHAFLAEAVRDTSSGSNRATSKSNSSSGSTGTGGGDGDVPSSGYGLSNDGVCASSCSSANVAAIPSVPPSTSSTSSTHKLHPSAPDTKSGSMPACGMSTSELLLRCQLAIEEAEVRFRGHSSNSSGSADTAHGQTQPAVSAFRGPSHDAEADEIGKSYLYFGTTARPAMTSLAPLKAKGRGLVVLVQLVTSTFRHLSLPRSKIASVMLLVLLGLASYDDEVLLKRVLPCLLLALADPSSSVRALSIRALTVILSSVRTITPFESNIYPQYLFAPLSVIARDGETPVRTAFAECLGAIAETARRFLEKAHLMAMTQAIADASASSAESEGKGKTSPKGKGKGATQTDPSTGAGALCGVHVEFPYDSKLKALHDQAIRWIRDVSSTHTYTHGQKGEHIAVSASLTSTTGASLVRRALLEDIGRLCVFFGPEATTDLLLTQILTFLNDQDWELRLAFCERIPTVCAFLGPTVTSECILPFLENALVDIEERVVAQSVRCITTLVQLKLLSRLMTVDAVKSASPLLLHPRPTIRQSALGLVEAAALALEATDAAVFLLPLLRPALVHNLNGASLTAKTLSRTLIDPLSWRAYRRILGERQASLMSPHLHSDFNECELPGNRSTSPHPNGDLLDRTQRGSGHGERTDSRDQSETPLADSWIVSSSPHSIIAEEEDDEAFGGSEWGECEINTAADTKAYIKKNRDRDKEVTETALEVSRVPVTVPFEDASEPTKVEYLRRYVELVARESLSRASHAQGQGQGQGGVSGLGVGVGVMPATQVESDREIISKRAEALTRGLFRATHTPSLAATGLSENLTHSLCVPHHRYRHPPLSRALTVGGTAPAPAEGAAIGSAFSQAPTAALSCISDAEREAAAKILSQPDSEIGLGGGLSSAAVHSIFGILSRDPLRGDMGHSNGNFIRNRSAGSLPSVRSGPVTTPHIPAGNQVSSSSSSSSRAVHGDGGHLSSSPSAPADSEEVDIEGERERERERDRGTDRELYPTAIFRGSGPQLSGAEVPLGCDDLRTLALINRLRALKVPPLPPDLGSLQHPDGKPYSSYLETLDTGIPDPHPTPHTAAYPRRLHPESPPAPLTLMCELKEHTAAVTRLATSPDQSYFASGSSDGTVKIWQLKGLDKAAFPRSSITYSGHGGGVTGLCVVENTHSMASASADGQVHVWRVELACSARRRPKDAKDGAVTGQPSQGLSVRALSVVRTLDPGYGSITSLEHFTADMASVIAYSTLRGAVLGWDLRSPGDAFCYTVRPEFGVSTCMALPPNMGTGWVVVGTSRGYVLMWDTRYNVMCGAWRHSSRGPIHKISCFHSNSALDSWAGAGVGGSPPAGRPEDDDEAYDTLDIDEGSPRELFAHRPDDFEGKYKGGGKGEGEGRGGGYLAVAAGSNEAAIWSLPIPRGGGSIRCFRAIPVANSRDRDRDKDAPRLISVPLPCHPLSPVKTAITSLLAPPASPPITVSMRSFLCTAAEGSAPSLVTGGDDGFIRHWSLASPSSCCVLAGLSPAQHTPAIVSIRPQGHGHGSCKGKEGEENYEELERAERPSKLIHTNNNNNSSSSSGSGNASQFSMFICYDTESPSSSSCASMLQSQLPLRDSKGISHAHTRSESAILDLRSMDGPKKVPLLLSCSTDGLIKLWR